MNAISLKTLAAWCNGRLIGKADSVSIKQFSKDTRTLQPGDLYLALRGENFDGHQFAGDAVKKGAIALLVERELPANEVGNCPQIVVDKSLQALQSIAAAWRNELSTLQVVCLTGSTGKTSTKDFITSILAQRYKVTATKGNLNNHIGVPLTILEASHEHEFAVWEIGMNHRGEIFPLAQLAKPKYAIITNIGVAHIENLGSVQAIAEEKGTLFKAVAEDGCVAIDGTGAFADYLASLASCRVIRTNTDRSAIRAEQIKTTVTGLEFDLVKASQSARVQMQTFGHHMISNALLAANIADAIGLDLNTIAAGLSHSKLNKGRLQLRTIAGFTILDDTYNANPDSVEAALAALASFPTQSRRVAVLGRMGELGHYAAEGYRRTGVAAARNADILITVGAEAEASSKAAREAGMQNVFHAENSRAAADLIQTLADPGDILLIKGSRSARMEEILNHIADHPLEIAK